MINDELVEDLFKEEIKDSYILHIPHSSMIIPDDTNFISENVDAELNLLTDHSTDRIFSVDGIDEVVFPYSRIFCDVERLDDENEEMFKHGRGFYYTKTDDGKELRKLDEQHKLMVYNDYYLKHHQKLNNLVNSKLDKYGFVNIIDCHSFSDEPFNTDIDKSKNRPNICIGTDLFHTSNDLFIKLVNHFQTYGFTVGKNSPYSGTIVPLEHYKKNTNVSSIMIEVNRKLYMDENNNVVEKSVEKLNTIIDEIFEYISIYK